MSQDKDTESLSDLLSGGEPLLLDDTLDRKQLSLTYEKFINDQRKQKEGVHDDDQLTPKENSIDGNVVVPESISSNRGKLDQIFEDVTEVFEKFENPFDATPGDKRKQSEGNVFVDKTPSKQADKSESNLNFFDATLRTAADEFRALKEKGIHGFDHSITDTNTGLIIDARKQDDNSTIENSMIDDDSSMKLNFIPHSSRPTYSNAPHQTPERVEPTQKDGNIHEEANRILVGQSKLDDNETSNLYILDE